VDAMTTTGSDKMEVTGIEIWAHHGVFEHERRDGQRFVIDVAWWLDTTLPARTDNLESTVDYGEVAQLIVAEAQSSPVDLIETLARRLQQALLARFPMDCVQITVHKPQAPIGVEFADVCLTSRAEREKQQRQVVFSLGSNIEPRLDYLQFALSGLASTPGIDRVRVSGVYETQPQSEVPQSDFLNAVLVAQSALPAEELLHRALAIESLAHRTRLSVHGPRTLDIDLISVGDEVWESPDLILPHPRARNRAFVLIPWLGLDAHARLGVHSVADLAVEVADQVVIPYQGTLFQP